jgi:Bacterial membrane protein YfhO
MQTGLSMKKNRNTVTDILLLIFITVIAYLPVSTFILSLKNDSLVQYLPYRYHLSESIQHGYFPFWNPYLYSGFPIHADMQGMTWNPIVLTISLFTRYNMSVLEFEVIIYLVLAAIGMYSLLKSFSLRRTICILGGISYMSCGFITGSASVIPWISSAAFIPFVFKYMKRLLEKPTLKTSLSFSISLSLLFLCGYPTFFIYTSYIILAVLLFATIIHFKKKCPQLNIKTVGFLSLSVMLFLFICSPAIISYWEFLPYYSRGSGISIAKAAQNPFTPFSSISFILPNTVNKNHQWLNTDTSMRNNYVGLFVFLLFLLSFLKKYDKWQKLILSITIFSFLLSLGSATPLHKLCYTLLPLFDTFRHPGNIRLFTSIGIILLAAFYAQKLIQLNKDEVKRTILPLFYLLLTVFGLVALYCILQTGVRENIGSAIKSIKQPKVFLDEFSFNSFLFIQCLIQIFFIVILIYQLGKKILNKKIVAGLFAFNSILFCWISLPFNFVSQIKTTTINQYVQSFPKGYSLPDINSSAETSVISDSVIISPYGYANFYSKRITIQDHVITPTLNHDYEIFCADRKLRSLMTSYPIAWLNDTLFDRTPDSITDNKKFSVYSDISPKPTIATQAAPSKIIITDWGPNSFAFRINSTSPSLLSIFQQYNHNWKVKVNGLTARLLKMNIAFMGVQVPGGENTIEFAYKPTKVINAIFLSLANILFIVLFFIIAAINNKPALTSFP